MTNHLLIFLALSAFLVFTTAQKYQCTANTFQVTGNGQITLTPDIVRLTISASGQGSNAAVALSKLNVQISAILKVFTSLSIPAGNYSTSAININLNYNYSNTPTTVIGSEATQSLQLTLNGPVILNSLLQSLSNINVTVQNLVFDVLDKTSALTKARAAAFVDARNKFNQYLSLASLSSGGLKKLVDLNSEVYTPYQTNSNNYLLFTKFGGNPDPVQVYASVSATWAVKP